MDGCTGRWVGDRGDFYVVVHWETMMLVPTEHTNGCALGYKEMPISQVGSGLTPPPCNPAAASSHSCHKANHCFPQAPQEP